MLKSFATALLLSAAFVAQPAFAQADDGSQPAAAAPVEKAWVQRSNENTQLYIEMDARFSPEDASSTGLEQYDGLSMDLGPDLDARYLAASRTLLATYQEKLAVEQDPMVRQDLEILIAALQRGIDGQALNARYMLDWYNVPQMVFRNISSLLDDQVVPERRKKAVELLQRYVGQYEGTTPLTELAKGRFAESRGEGKFGPYRGDLKDALSKTETYSAGIRELFGKYKIKGADKALAAMDKQFAGYKTWSEATVQPLARDDFRLPPEIYAFRLKLVGIDIPPAELISRARRGFYETRAQMSAVAPLVAAKYGFAETDYPSVILNLKKTVVPRDELEGFYAGVSKTLEEIIRRENIVTLPDYPMQMRLATPAEAAAQPAPHMQPPRLIGNQGERGQFILTTSEPGADAAGSFDDFNFAAASWTLSAHEGRPGHELQFASMVDRGVSLARVLYAFNSVNAEGWALYAEAEMLPYEPVEGQLIGMQHRLLRASRAFLDPMLNLGMIDLDEARRVLSEEAMFSPAMVKQELDRYTFRWPGQAGSYYYGYSKLIDLRIETEMAMGDAFDRKAFNDFILGEGLLPLDLLAKTVREDFVPAKAAK